MKIKPKFKIGQVVIHKSQKFIVMDRFREGTVFKYLLQTFTLPVSEWTITPEDNHKTPLPLRLRLTLIKNKIIKLLEPLLCLHAFQIKTAECYQGSDITFCYPKVEYCCIKCGKTKVETNKKLYPEDWKHNKQEKHG